MTDLTKNALFKTHIEMWKHYNTQRQAKSGNFLTANSVLAAVAGFAFEDAAELVVAISVVGVFVGVLWFLLLLRNSAYISYHRKLGNELPESLWRPETSTPESRFLDGGLPVVFALFWCIALSLSIWRVLG